MGRPELAGEGPWGTYRRREAARDAVDELVGEWTRSMPRQEVLALCEREQVPCGPVYSIDEIFADPQYEARGNIRIVEDSRAGRVAVPAPVPRLAATPGGIDRLGPALGAHTREVLGGMLGLSDERIAELRAKGVV
jgi:crotonobetainyl-CoA:carnitine CoA-transferase CaiB-like acyl-CoA transferase